MTKALLMEREAFIELLILNGFSMHKFLSVKVTWETWDHMYVGLSESQKLRDLYNEAAERHTHLLEQVPQSKPFIIYHQKWSAMVTDVIICHQIVSHSAHLRIPLLI